MTQVRSIFLAGGAVAILAIAVVAGSEFTADRDDGSNPSFPTAMTTFASDYEIPAQVGSHTSSSPLVDEELLHAANLVVYCDIGGTEHAVGSFAVCDAAGGNPTAAEV